MQKRPTRTGYHPADRERPVSAALRAYAAMVTSADRGAVRDVTLLDRTAAADRAVDAEPAPVA